MPSSSRRHRNTSAIDKSNSSTIIVIVLVTIAFILLGMFSFTSKPQNDHSGPDGVDKYGRALDTQSGSSSQ